VQFSLSPAAYYGPSVYNHGRGRANASHLDALADQVPLNSAIPAYLAIDPKGTSVVHTSFRTASAHVVDDLGRGRRGHTAGTRASVDVLTSTGLPNVPFSIGLLASASSAAAGLLGSPVVMQQLFDTVICGASDHHRRIFHHTDSRTTLTEYLWPIIGAENYAPCSSGDPSSCDFPSSRLMDGSYTDNLGVVAAIVDLQRRYPLAPSFRLFVSFANSCASTGPLTMASCVPNDNSLERLFANPPMSQSGSLYPSTPGGVYTTAQPPVGILELSQQIFAEASPDEWDSHGPSAFRTMTVDVTTVDNLAYGVHAGSNVTLLVFFGNAGTSCPTMVMPDAETQKIQACAALSSGSREFVLGLGKAPSIAAYAAGKIKTAK